MPAVHTNLNMFCLPCHYFLLFIFLCHLDLYVIGSAKMCLIEKKKKIQQAIKHIGHANKTMRKVENSHLLPFLCLSLKYEANTATCSRVTTRKTIVFFTGVYWKSRFQSVFLKNEYLQIYCITERVTWKPFTS